MRLLVAGGAGYIGSVVALQLLEEGHEVTGRDIETVEVPRRAGDPPVLVASSQKIRDELGWVPEKPGLSDMISDAWAWMREHPRGYG